MPKDMPSILVRRYGEMDTPEGPVKECNGDWLGWIEPEDLKWVLFIDSENNPVLFTKRDPNTGAVLE